MQLKNHILQNTHLINLVDLTSHVKHVSTNYHYSNYHYSNYTPLAGIIDIIHRITY